MLTVVCFKWFDPNGRYNDRIIYTAEHVNRLRRMVDRHLKMPHRFVCITDDEAGLDPEVGTYPIDRSILSEAGHRFPKLMIFRPDAPEFLGERVLLLDLDTVIVGPLDPLLDRNEHFVAWREPRWGKKAGVGKYNSSMVLLTAGSHPEVWTRFRPAAGGSPAFTHSAGHSDQAWIAHALGEDHPVWTPAEGVLSFKIDVARKRLLTRSRDPSLPTRLPPHARIVFFHGGVDPSAPEFQAKHGWVRENWV